MAATMGGTSDTATEEMTAPGAFRVGALSRSGLPDLQARGRHPDSYGIGSGKAVRVEADSGDSISILLYVLGDFGSGRGVFNYGSHALYPQYVSSMSVGFRFRSTRGFVPMFRSFCLRG